MPCVECPADIETYEGDVGCDSCAPEDHWQCGGCDEWYRDGSPCEDCVTCARCDDLVPDDDTVETVRGSTICADCQRDYYWQCEVCDGWNRDGNDCGNGCCDPDSCDCDECRDNDDDFGGLVNDYSYKPCPVFHGTGPVFLGPEIEIETPYSSGAECAEIADAHLGSLGYLKTDASIEHGFEIVTHPMSYDWAIANFPWQMLTQLQESGCSAGDGTGIHVHVSRAGFTSACHTYRWMKLCAR